MTPGTVVLQRAEPIHPTKGVDTPASVADRWSDRDPNPRSTRRVLVITSDATRGSRLLFSLQSDTLSIAVSPHTARIRHVLKLFEPALVVLSVEQPRAEALDILRRIRQRGRAVRILVVDRLNDRRGLEELLQLGADNVVDTRVSPGTLLAVAQELLGVERTKPRPDLHAALERQATTPQTLHLGRALIQFDSGDMVKDGRSHQLTDTELALLRALVKREGGVVTLGELKHEVWNDAAINLRVTVAQHVARLRRKLEDDPRRPRHLLTVYSRGYRLEL